MKISAFIEKHWEARIDAVVNEVNTFNDANLDNGELCRTPWENYAFVRWTNNPYAALFETELIDPVCKRVSNQLSEFEARTYLAYWWDEYCEDIDPGVNGPEELSADSTYKCIEELLTKAVYRRAMSDGCEVENRSFE